MADGPPYGIEYVRVELCAFVFHQLYCGTDAMGNIRYGRHYANDGESNTKDFQRREVAFELCVSCLPCGLGVGQRQVGRPCLYPRLANSSSSFSSVSLLALASRLDPMVRFCAAIYPATRW